MKFTWNTDLYDSKHSFVSQYGEEILDLLHPGKEEEILDLGCGTGDLTKRISELSKEVIGVDNSPEMIKKAKEKYPSIKFVAGDIKDFNIGRPFDAVFSNAVLHWIPEAEIAVQNINKHLKVNGRFVAEFGGKGCVNKIITELIKSLKDKRISYPAVNEVLFYPSISEYTAILEKNGFEVTDAVLFDRPTELKDGFEGLNHFIEMFLNWIFKEASPQEKKEVIDSVNRNLKKELFINSSWIADYRRIRIRAIKTL